MSWTAESFKTGKQRCRRHREEEQSVLDLTLTAPQQDSTVKDTVATAPTGDTEMTGVQHGIEVVAVLPRVVHHQAAMTTGEHHPIAALHAAVPMSTRTFLVMMTVDHLATIVRHGMTEGNDRRGRTTAGLGAGVDHRVMIDENARGMSTDDRNTVRLGNGLL